MACLLYIFIISLFDHFQVIEYRIIILNKKFNNFQHDKNKIVKQLEKKNCIMFDVPTNSSLIQFET